MTMKSILSRLDSYCIAKPSRLDVFVIEGAMLWPEDYEMQQKWVFANLVEMGQSKIDFMPPDLLRRHAKVNRNAPRKEQLQEAGGNDRFMHGFLAGIIIAETALRLHLSSENSTVGNLQDEICNNLKGGFQIEPRTMNNKTGPIYKFRKVAHLWAAYALQRLRLEKTHFPCLAPQVPEFLAIAETFRKLAEATRLKRSKYTVLRPGEAITLPAAVLALLPEVKFFD